MKMANMAGVTQANAWFTENGAFATSMTAVPQILLEIYCNVSLPKKVGKRSSITFFGFWSLFVHFPDAFVTFLPRSFCRTPFAAGRMSLTRI